MSNASSSGSEQGAEAPIFRMNEMEQQLDVLRRHDVFEGRLEGAFDRMTRIAADLFDAEEAFVVFLNSSHQWLEEHVDLGRSERRAVASWCTRVVKEGRPLVIDRTQEGSGPDPPTPEMGLDFYAGVPVEVSEETCIGVCAIIDSTPRSFADSQKRRLGDVGQMISEKLERRRQTHKHEDLAQERAAVCRRHDAMRQDPDMMVGVVEANGTLLETNETSLRYIEARREEVIGEPFWETPWWDEEDRERVRAWIGQAAEGEYVRYQAGSNDAKSRSYRVEGKFRPVVRTGEEGEEQVEAVMVTARDVTERERRLRQAEVLFQNAQDAFFLLDVREEGGENTFAYRRVNPVYEKKFGHSEEEIRGRSPRDVFGEELGQFLEGRCRTCARRGEPVEHEETIPLSGKPTYWFTRIAPVFVEGEVQQIVGHATEITDRKRRKKRLERQNDLFQRAQEIANVGAWEYDVKTGDLRATRQTYRIHGYPVEEELTAEEAFSHYHPEDRADIEKAVEQAVEDGASYDLELRLQAETGTERWVRDRGEPQWEDGEVVRIRGTLRDITERKEREQRLQQIETLFQNVQEPLFLLDVQENATEFCLKRVNPAYEEKFGRTAKGVLGKSPEEIFGEKFGTFMEKKCRECVRRGEALQYEEKIPFDGAITYWKTRIAPVTVGGDVQQIVGHATNITDQKRRERTLRERQDKIEALYKTADRLIRASSKETVGTVLVRLIRTALGYQAVAVRFVQDEQLVVTEVSETNFEFMPERPDFSVDGDSPIAEVYRSGQTLVIGDVDEEIDDEDDKVHPQNYYGNPGSGVVVPVGGHGTLAVASQEPQAIGPFDRHLIEVLGSYAAVVLDQLGQEQTLRERQEKIEALYEATQRLLTAEEFESVSTRIHELLEDIFDYPLQNTGFVDGESIVPDQTAAEHAVGVPPPERRSTDGDSLSAQALRAGDTVVIDDAGSLDNDVEYGALRTAAAVPIGERGVVVIGKTEVEAFDPFNLRLIEVLSGYAALVLNRLDREATLRDAKEEAEEASRMKSALLANMSHEIRTPLTSIIGFAEVAGTEASTLDLPTDSPLPDCADRIERGGKRLLDTLEGVLNLSKLEAGQMELDAEPVPLISEVQRVAEELQPKAREKKIDLRLETESAWAKADEGGVQIIARNLLSNAIKYTEADGTVWVRSYRADGRAVLEVEDTGIGMAPEAVDNLFEPFRQASEGFSREYEGTGVGLAVTKRAAEEMDGSVDVDTEEGEGSRFTVRLPTAGENEPSGNGEQTH
ncbi:PAS domain-containing protein [Salinibacter sp.]|uniref:PAS domain-containing protein n=1 Tax=Salinibacter sp. TaxID=2065818 RepID=UPI0021E894B7|nr:PAS domain-containing protein [Salinibacter sp.]